MPSSAASTPSIDHRLLEAAVDHFGRTGFDGSSTREIAADANTTMSAITYHYGGKEGLYLAAAQHIALQIGERMRSALVPVTGIGQPESAEDAEGAVLSIIDHFVQMMVRPESESWARFIVREQIDPTAAFDSLYGGAMGVLLDHLSTLIARCSDQALERRQLRLMAITIVGQALVFRFARATVLRATGWHEIGPKESAAIRRTVRTHTRAILADARAASA